MDADLARVARGVAVSQKTEDAMTQVLAGAGIAAAPTAITRPRAVTPPPAPPAYRPPSSYYDYEEPPPVAADLALAARAARARDRRRRRAGCSTTGSRTS